MGKILGSWSGMRKYLEQEILAETLKGRVRYGCTSYVGMDGCHIFEICIDGKQVKRFSWETVNTFFLQNGYKQNTDSYGVSEYWEEFCKALEIYRNQSIQESIASPNPIIRMFAVLDRRVGKRTLQKIKFFVENQPQWLAEIYQLRLEAEEV